MRYIVLSRRQHASVGLCLQFERSSINKTLASHLDSRRAALISIYRGRICSCRHVMLRFPSESKVFMYGTGQV